MTILNQINIWTDVALNSCLGCYITFLS